MEKKKLLVLGIILPLILGYYINISCRLNSISNNYQTNRIKESIIYYNNLIIISDDNTNWNNDDSHAPSLALDNNGREHIVWEDDTDGIWDTDTEIMYAYNTGLGWSNATVISDGYNGVYWNDGNSFNPSIAIDNNSNIIHIVWADTTDGVWGTDLDIMYCNFTQGIGWSNATVISDGYNGVYWNDGSSTSPSIAADNIGGIHVIWLDYTSGPWGNTSEIMYTSNSGSGWSNATVISDGYNGVYWNNGPHWDLDISIDNLNNIHVVWSDETDGIWGTNMEILYTSNSGSGWSNATVISDGYNGVYWNDGDNLNPSITADIIGG
ncbi:MAG: hypothetical protein KGD63_04445, partial [Candidatus Lokiarchaeota archaeon]|nr:hypothetical protein [Candidatus Lokiarchaeota archaeon]